MKAPFTAAAVATLACLTLAACTVHQTETPPVTGPSDLAFSVRLEAVPDSIGQDGGSQSRITVFANGPDGKPFSGLALRVDMAVNTSQGQVVQDFGALSARSIVTGPPNPPGVALVSYTAPAAPPNGATGTCNGLPGTCVTIIVTPTDTPVHSGFGTMAPQTITIRLVPLGVILPPPTTPTPCITMSPASPAANVSVQFTAGTLVSGVCTTATSDILAFDWSFGDGGTASGRIVTHTFATANIFVVTLTETNDRGIAASATQQVTIGAANLPEPEFSTSPGTPGVNDTVFFNASSSTPGAGHTIVSYSWDFGDGSTGSGVTTTHQYAAVGTFTVVLTVRDEAGQSFTKSHQVTINSGAPTASFTFAVINAPAHRMGFDGSGSTAQGSATITSYQWTFGDTTSGSGQTITHDYPATGTFTVRLTVTDSLGRVGSTSQSVSVP